MLIFMNMWMVRKNSVKHYCLNEKIFTVTQIWKILLQMEDADYTHAKGVCRYFEINNLGEYQNLYVESDTLLLADVFENFKNICFKIFELDPAKFLSASELA